MIDPTSARPARFFRIDSDRLQTNVPVEDLFSGPQPSACWLIGGGPSLAKLPIDDIVRSPVPKMCVNLAGTRLLRPTFWTAYDPPVRFHRSVFLDSGVMKFLPRQRAMDVVPETSFKVCDCPNLLFFERDPQRTFSDFLSPDADGIADWRDSMVLAIDVLYRLGFRIIYLAGCEMHMRPSPEQVRLAASFGVNYVARERLREFLDRCHHAGLTDAMLDEVPAGRQYHFAEWKPVRAAATSDEHYFKVAQYLRLSRRSIVSAGLQLVSVTPHSRLNDDFPYRTARRVLRDIQRSVGNPGDETATGLYRELLPRNQTRLCPMQDFPSRRPDLAQRKRELQRAAVPEPTPAISTPTLVEPDLLVEFEGWDAG